MITYFTSLLSNAQMLTWTTWTSGYSVELTVCLIKKKKETRQTKENKLDFLSPFGRNMRAATLLVCGSHTPFPAVQPSQLRHHCTHQHLLHKNNLQLLVVKWRLHHMPASHLVCAMGARQTLAEVTKSGRRTRLTRPIKDAPVCICSRCSAITPSAEY